MRAPAIDEAPLDLFLRSGVKLDFRHFGDGYVATAADVAAELNRIGHELRPFDIVLVNTTAGAAYGSADYVSKGCGVGPEATLFLTSHGVRVVGTDAWSWDAPFIYTARRYAESRNADIIWEGHKAGRIRGYYQMEKLHGLEGLLIRRRLATGAIEPLSVPARSWLAGVRPVMRALLFAAAAALLLAPSTAALLGLLGLTQLPFGAFVAFKAGLALVYAAAIAPPLVALALSS